MNWICNLTRNRKQPQGTPVKITISLSSRVEVPKSGVLIVSIHSADGSPMPIAAGRYPLTEFPVTVVLDDSNSMIESRELLELVRYYGACSY